VDWEKWNAPILNEAKVSRRQTFSGKGRTTPICLEPRPKLSLLHLQERLPDEGPTNIINRGRQVSLGELLLNLLERLSEALAVRHVG
jgi:hypothetical protein